MAGGTTAVKCSLCQRCVPTLGPHDLFLRVCPLKFPVYLLPILQSPTSKPKGHGLMMHVSRGEQKLDVSEAPGWGTLIGKKAHGIETGLQCPMCANSTAKKSSPRY
jgi:hypothetical protein